MKIMTKARVDEILWCHCCFEEEREGPPEQPTEVSEEKEAEALILTHLLQGGCLRCPVPIRRRPITSSLGPKRPDIDKNPGQSQHCLEAMCMLQHSLLLLSCQPGFRHSTDDNLDNAHSMASY